MSRVWFRVAAAGLLAGCQSSAPRAVYDGNPLLQARQPLVNTPAMAARPGPAPSVVHLPVIPEPQAGPTLAALPPPPPTPTILPASPEPPEAVAEPVVAAASVVSLPGPVIESIELPVVRSAELDAELPAGTTFARGRDYRWLQGTIERHYRGHRELRFCPCTEDEAIGGKVELVEDARLDQFREGELVRVRGELIGDVESPRPGGRALRYAVREVQRVKP